MHENWAVHSIIGLVEGKIYRKPWFLPLYESRRFLQISIKNIAPRILSRSPSAQGHEFVHRHELLNLPRVQPETVLRRGVLQTQPQVVPDGPSRAGLG